MPKATFYTHVGNPADFTLRLTARAIREGSGILIWVGDTETAAKLDSDLWSTPPESFIPHEIWQPDTPFPQHLPVVLAYGNRLPLLPEHTVVLNLSADFWSNAPKHPVRILEIVGSSLEELADARERFRTYRACGFEIEHFDMNGKA